MRVYESEKKDGIDFKVNAQGNSSSVLGSKIKVEDIKKYIFDGMSIADLVKATDTVQTIEELLGQKQPDLALVVAILVSTGWNLNDDIFTPTEVWKARSSPLHKPINDNHNPLDILGHIVQSRALDKSGNEIELSDGEVPPDNFDLEVAGVLYRAFDKISDRIDTIIDKANAGEIFVSMEAWFPDFGYGFVDPKTDGTKLVDRTEETAFLTKHLKIYGGSGKYQGYKIGRVLKDIVFSAQGFVDVPANPESVIKVAANKVDAAGIFVTAKLSELMEGGVGDMTEKELKELQEKLQSVQAELDGKIKENAELKKGAEEFAAKDYDGQIVTLKEEVGRLTEASKNATAEKDELQKNLDEVTKLAEKSKAELDEITKNETARNRMEQLSKIKKIDDEKATLAELKDMTKETFELVVKYAGEAKVEGVVEDKNDDQNGESAEAALDNVTEDDTAELNTVDDDKNSEDENMVSLAHLLCGKEEKNEGGE